MATLDSLYVSKINNINIIQEGESVLSAENNEADYSKPKGGNHTVQLGAGQETIELSFRTISDTNTSAIKKVLRVGTQVTLIDKFKGKFKVTITSYSITDSDSHIGVTKFKVSLKVVEELKPPLQNLASSLMLDSELLSDVIDTSDLVLDNVSLIDSAIGTVEDVFLIFDSVSNFANGVMNKVSEFKNMVKGYINRISLIIHKPQEFKKELLSVINDFIGIFSAPKSALSALMGIKTQKNIKNYYKISSYKVFDPLMLKTLNPKDAQLLQSNFKITELHNTSVMMNVANIMKVSVMLKVIPTIQFDSMEEAKIVQASIEETLSEILGSDDLVQKIKNDLSTYIQSLNLPNVVTITVFQKPFFMLSYELYGTLDRANSLRMLNNFREDDNVTGVIKVFDK